MAKYKLQENGVFDQENNMFIPNDPANRHWQEYQEWLAEGNQPDPMYTLDELKQQKLRQLKQELQNFIYSHYDQGTQASFVALYQQAKEQNNTEALTQIQKVWDWIQSVLNYYYSKKEAIKNATTQDELDGITWNWQEVEEEFHVELQDVINMLTQQ